MVGWGVHGRGNAWLGACLAEGTHGWGHVWGLGTCVAGACMVGSLYVGRGGMHGGEGACVVGCTGACVAGGAAWWGHVLLGAYM